MLPYQIDRDTYRDATPAEIDALLTAEKDLAGRAWQQARRYHNALRAEYATERPADVPEAQLAIGLAADRLERAAIAFDHARTVRDAYRALHPELAGELVPPVASDDEDCAAEIHRDELVDVLRSIALGAYPMRARREVAA